MSIFERRRNGQVISSCCSRLFSCLLCFLLVSVVLSPALEGHQRCHSNGSAGLRASVLLLTASQVAAAQSFSLLMKFPCWQVDGIAEADSNQVLLARFMVSCI